MRKLVVVVFLLSALFLGWYWEVHRPLRRADDPPQTLVVPPGASVALIGARLRDLGLVPHPLVFRAVAVLRGEAGRLRAGEYAIEGPMSLAQILDKMVRGDVVHREITFPEGKNIEEMAQIVAAHDIPGAAFLAAARDPAAVRDLDPKATDLEGYLFPDTYEPTRTGDVAATLVARMMKRFRDVVSPDLPRIAAGTMSLREVVTLASIVELETARPEERPRIAAVFLNRLRIGMPLQTDPTVIYALRKAGTYDGNIRRGDLDVESPYNTYRHPGLPPGPIASPGKASLRAVLDPAPVKDLYFVSRNDGSHQFSATLAEHARAVDFYQRGHGAPPPGASPLPSPALLPSPSDAPSSPPSPSSVPR
jgi:UPF0755 protein